MSLGIDVCLSSQEEPSAYLEASKDEVWMKAMKEELEAIEKSGTWELIFPPADCRPIGVKWVFKINAQIARFESIRVLMVLAAQGRWELRHLDVKSTFLNGEIEKEIYVKQLEGFIVKGKEECVFRLKKALYGLKQVPRSW